VMLIFVARSFDLGILQGTTYAEVSRNNRLDRSIIFSDRGVISDRTGRELAWNEAAVASTTPYALRRYIGIPGLSLLLGFVRYPKADARQVWWREETGGASGLELALDGLLAGKNGSSMVELDARGSAQRENIVDPPENGADIKLSVDAEVQSRLFSLLSAHARTQGFVGGAAAIMDIKTGELIALTSFPEYDNGAFTDGDAAAVGAASSDPRSPLLNRAVSGLYTPGSIVKPIFAAAALNEQIIAPETEILSTGAITVPNPYDPDRPSIYRDWAVHGLVDMREALAVSSDEYFYTIGGGYGSQAGLGIGRLDEYARRFGLGAPTGITLVGEEAGVIPTPEWKAATFADDGQWRIGNTYHTAIGQYAMQVTPIAVARAVAAIANGGKLVKPTLLKDAQLSGESLTVDADALRVVREGMRLAVTLGTASGLASLEGIVHAAAKTGTAQTGAKNEYYNSWAVGFFPYEDPKYVFMVVMERGPAGNPTGGVYIVQQFLTALSQAAPEYFD